MKQYNDFRLLMKINLSTSHLLNIKRTAQEKPDLCHKESCWTHQQTHLFLFFIIITIIIIINGNTERAHWALYWLCFPSEKEEEGMSNGETFVHIIGL